ncbi:MAG TPA: hypothetical protein VM536_11720 [Chloroflexia bacterium]|nr:hypothetical protein [Chloroflexia bacterium]
MPALFRKKTAPAEVPVLKSAPSRAAVATYTAGSGGYGTGAAAAAKAPRFQYAPLLWLPVRIVGYGLILLGILNVVDMFRRFAALPSVTYYSALLLITAFTSFLFSFVAGALIADTLPSFEVRPDGLAVTEFARWRVLRWDRIVKLHSMTLPGERYVIFIEYAGAPLSPEHVVYALLAGLGPKSGIFYTSDIKDFDDLTRGILEMRMRATPGLRMEDLLVENVPMPVLQMTADPHATMKAVAGIPEDAPSSPIISLDDRPVVPRAALMRQQLGMALVPVLLFWVDTLVNGGIPFLTDTGWSLISGTVALLLLGMLELPFVALAIQALGENTLGSGEFQAALRTYPHLEMPRMIAFAAVFALVAVRWPFPLVFLLWLAAIGWTAYLTLRFTERLYRIPEKQAYLAAGASALVQLLVLLAYTMLRGAGVAG